MFKLRLTIFNAASRRQSIDFTQVVTPLKLKFQPNHVLEASLSYVFPIKAKSSIKFDPAISNKPRSWLQ